MEHVLFTGGQAVGPSGLPGALLGSALADLFDNRPVPTLLENMRRLHEESRRIRDAQSYMEGTWVTPRSDVSVRGYGEPHLVIRSRGVEAYVISIVGDDVHARWIENWQLEPWDQAKHEID